ncbi:MAG TPA: hypothetical protein VHA57_03185 [Actinomycetota bacterium]|nr:hypothetical protein [Actinomycetota bacterium]
MGPILSRHYVACPPPVQRDMSLREIQAHLDALAPAEAEPADERDAQMMQHPALRGR